ncbi:MAG: hypothetical protein ACO1OF_18110 [Adhaeribacter sp.]
MLAEASRCSKILEAERFSQKHSAAGSNNQQPNIYLSGWWIARKIQYFKLDN